MNVWKVTPMLFLTMGTGLLLAQTPAIQHVPVPCVAPGEYPVIDAVISPGADIRTAKVYFRAAKYPKFYYLEMGFDGSTFSTALPKPSLETEQIVYYIEAVDVTFNNTVGDEHVAEVREDCQAQQDLPEEPELIVGATEAGASASPPGFQTVGIVGTITSAGVASLLSGGSGIGTAAVVGGVAAAGAGGVVVAAAIAEEPRATEPEPTASVPPPPEPPPSPTSSAPPSTDSPTPPSGPTEPPSPEPSPPDSTEPPDPPPPPPPSAPVRACFVGSFPGGSCNLKLLSSCSTGPIVSYQWVIDASPALGGSTVSTEANVNRNFPGCAGETVSVTLTVGDGAGGVDSATDTFQLPVSQRVESHTASHPMAVISLLRAEGAAGRVVLDDARVDVTESMIPFRHEFAARRGEHHIEAVVARPGTGDVMWEFDFSSADHFVPGSLRAEAGQVLAVTSRRILFRSNGTPGERLRFSFDVSP
jgi:hypothetical protein